jgi:hypothetical protein
MMMIMTMSLKEADNYMFIGTDDNHDDTYTLAVEAFIMNNRVRSDKLRPHPCWKQASHDSLSLLEALG